MEVNYAKTISEISCDAVVHIFFVSVFYDDFAAGSADACNAGGKCADKGCVHCE